ncbi:unnamed protein product [Camellia sinensis]
MYVSRLGQFGLTGVQNTKLGPGLGSNARVHGRAWAGLGNAKYNSGRAWANPQPDRVAPLLSAQLFMQQIELLHISNTADRTPSVLVSVDLHQKD